MNLEDLKGRKPTCQEFQWRGGPVWLRKLSAKDHVELFGRIKKADKTLDTDGDRMATVNFHVDLVSRSLCDEHGALLKDSSDVREFLMEGVGFSDLVELGAMALRYSGYDPDAPEKKPNSQTSSDSPSSSASP